MNAVQHARYLRHVMPAYTRVDPAAIRAHPVCRRIKAAVHAVEPGAEVLLFGSRARGDAREDSDWDVLVLLEGAVSWDRSARVSDSVYRRVTADSFEHIVGTLVRERTEWGRRIGLAGLPTIVAEQGVRL